ncbi:MAG TPA: DUF2203 domain-containing protein [Candidatus Micrarchaeaceae archaeon]|nr:DUF2203 domain-containing protein [Candidatus Micrarchaeaceae archaeon]
MADRPGAPDRPESAVPSYSVNQASRLLPALTQVLRSLIIELGIATDPDALGQLRSAEGHNGGGAAASAMLQAGARVEREMEFLKRHGILLRDATSGLVDFPATRQGRPIFLCWRLGEPAIGYWHGRDEGYVHRRPL